MTRQRILITGPGGRVGPHIIPLLRPRYALRLVDMKPLSLTEDDEFIQADIRDLEAMRMACMGVAAVIHLAAVSDEADFKSKLLPMNLEGVHAVFEAARLAGVPKVIFTSTAQTVLYYPPGQWVDVQMRARPFTIYACTKLFGEALASYYSDTFGMSMICIRLCWFQNYDSPLLKSQPDMRREWCSPRDFTQLLDRSLKTPLKFGLYFGVSNNTGRYWDISNAQADLGYQPMDDGLDYPLP